MQKKLIIPGQALALALAGGWAFMPASKTLSPADYAAWLHNPENELRCSASAEQIELTALYKPRSRASNKTSKKALPAAVTPSSPNPSTPSNSSTPSPLT